MRQSSGADGRAAEIRVQHDAGGVDNGAEREGGVASGLIANGGLEGFRFEVAVRRDGAAGDLRTEAVENGASRLEHDGAAGARGQLFEHGPAQQLIQGGQASQQGSGIVFAGRHGNSIAAQASPWAQRVPLLRFPAGTAIDPAPVRF